VIFRRDSRQRLSSIFAQGHTDWSQSGTDIVCAAVSAILQAAQLGLQEVAHIPLGVNLHSGTMTLGLQEAAHDDPSLRAILDTAELSLAHLARQYPESVAVRSEAER